MLDGSLLVVHDTLGQILVVELFLNETQRKNGLVRLESKHSLGWLGVGKGL